MFTVHCLEIGFLLLSEWNSKEGWNFSVKAKKEKKICVCLCFPLLFCSKQSLKCQEWFTEGLGHCCGTVQGWFEAQGKPWFKTNVNMSSSVVGSAVKKKSTLTLCLYIVFHVYFFDNMICPQTCEADLLCQLIKSSCVWWTPYILLLYFNGLE